MGAGTAGYCVGNLLLEGVPIPGEEPSKDFVYPDVLAPPLQVHQSSSYSLLRPLNPSSGNGNMLLD